MIALGLLSLLFPLLGILLIVWAIITIVQAVTRPRRASSWPACERCRYAVSDLSTFICPECGSDLRQTGIITPAMEARRRGSTVAALIAWTFLCASLGYVVFIVGFMFFGYGAAMSSVTTTSTWNQTLTPRKAVPYANVTLSYDADFQALTGNMDITLTGTDGAAHTLVLDPFSLQISGLDSGTANWNADVMQSWFAELGFDTTDPQVIAAADEVGRVIDVTVTSPNAGYSLSLNEHFNALTTTGGFATSSMASPFGASGAYFVIALAAGTIIYIVGLVLIVVRRRHMLAAADA